jgi:uncharacterized membrane protein
MPEFELELHPMLVHFPIAFFMSAFLFQGLGLLFKKSDFHKSALYLYLLGVFISPLTVQTGLWEAEELHLNHPVLLLHRTFALWTMWLSLTGVLVLWIIHRKAQKLFQIIFFLTLLFIVCCVSLAAYNGGRLVYEYGIGIEE